jgi:hypothetical protein
LIVDTEGEYQVTLRADETFDEGSVKQGTMRIGFVFKGQEAGMYTTLDEQWYYKHAVYCENMV